MGIGFPNRKTPLLKAGLVGGRVGDYVLRRRLIRRWKLDSDDDRPAREPIFLPGGIIRVVAWLMLLAFVVVAGGFLWDFFDWLLTVLGWPASDARH